MVWEGYKGWQWRKSGQRKGGSDYRIDLGRSELVRWRKEWETGLEGWRKVRMGFVGHG